MQCLIFLFIIPIECIQTWFQSQFQYPTVSVCVLALMGVQMESSWPDTCIWVCAACVCELCKSSHICTVTRSGLLTCWYYCSSSAGFAQLYNSELLQYECCSINCAVPMAALRDEAKERTSQFMSGNGPAGLSSANMETVLGLPGSDGVW